MSRATRFALGFASAAVMVVGTFAFAGEPSGRPNDDDRGQDRIERGFKLAPVHLDLRHKNPALVGLGSYIVNAQGGCNDCHTCPPFTPEHDPYTGGDGVPNATNYLAGGTAFGPFVSRNITPDASGKPAGLTRDEFIELMRKGHDPDNPTELLQVMPWPIYGRMVRRDLEAVYAYLSAIPHAETSAECVQPPEQ
jgi:hypothetical protein